ncbi:non-ribosomal peptide synthetase, partial [Caldalkalibacillus mannanilyticus]|uniref:non-ribosomal peptide synthetase n=1 Tax=Caldalkalibacillus mannanilyticus TaxID=1418 RepID=UPI000558947B
MKKSLEFMVAKHEILRTKFFLEGDAFQVVYKKVDAHITEIDLCGHTKQAQEQLIQTDFAEDRERPFQLNQEIGWRMKLYKLGEERFVIGWIFHHAILDGWSVASFMTELMNVYFQYKENKVVSPVRLKSSYKDYIIDQWSVQRTPEIIEFWKEELKEYKRFPIQSYIAQNKEYHSVSRVLAGELFSKLKEVARRHSADLKTLCFAAYAMTLHMFSNEDEFVVGLVEHGRPICEDGEKILGCFLNTIPFKVRFEAKATLENIIAEMNQKRLKMKNYGRLSLPQIVGAVGEAHHGSNPFFDVIFNYIDFHVYNQVDSQDVFEESLAIEEFEKTNTLLDMTTSTTFDTLHVQMASFLPKEMINRMIDYYERILSAMAEGTNREFKKEDYISLGEKQQILKEFNATAVEYPLEKTVHQLFEEQVERTPEGIAVVYQGQQLTYQELNEKGNRLAHTLREKGVNKEQLVAILAERSIELLVGIIGVLKAGGAYVPIDPEYPTERIRYMLEDSGAQVLLRQQHLQDRVSYAGQTLILEEAASYSNQTSRLEETSDPANLAYVIYTSGTTGQPKGVMVEHRSLVNLCTWHQEMYELTEKDRSTLYAGVGFDASVWEIFPYLLSGATIYVVDEDSRLNPIQLEQFFSEHDITISFLPTQLSEQFMEMENHTLRALLIGGDKLKHYQPQPYALYNNYGPTENTVVATA